MTSDRRFALPEGLPRPVPEPDGLSGPYWEGANRGELWIQRCRSCQAWQSAETMKYLLGAPGRAVRVHPRWPGLSSRQRFGSLTRMSLPAGVLMNSSTGPVCKVV